MAGILVHLTEGNTALSAANALAQPKVRTSEERLNIKIKGLHLLNSQCKILTKEARLARTALNQSKNVRLGVWQSLALLEEPLLPHELPEFNSTAIHISSSNFSIERKIEALDNAATRSELRLDFLARKIQNAKMLLYCAIAKMSNSLPFSEEVRSASQELLDAISR